jgi:hypothetical protein
MTTTLLRRLSPDFVLAEFCARESDTAIHHYITTTPAASLKTASTRQLLDMSTVYLHLPTLVILLVNLLQSTQAFSPSSIVPTGNQLSNMIITWEREAESQIRSLASQVRRADAATKTDTPFMVSIVGIPGSGKSTCADILGDFLSDNGCLVFPHVSTMLVSGTGSNSFEISFLTANGLAFYTTGRLPSLYFQTERVPKPR